MSAKHTQGPWRRMPYRDSTNLSLTITSDSGDIAHVHGWQGEPDHHDADAHLIAAAPDLLAACEALLSFVIPYAVPNTDEGRKKLEARVAAEDAIAKAKGGAR